VNRAGQLARWIPAAAWMALLWVLSDQSAVQGPAWAWDKALHASAYAVLGLFCLWAAHRGLRPPAAGATLLALAVVLGYGAVDELHQLRVPGRQADVRDWVADAVGAGISVALFACGERALGATRRNPPVNRLPAPAGRAETGRPGETR